MEAINGLKEPGGSNKTTIATYIEVLLHSIFWEFMIIYYLITYFSHQFAFCFANVLQDLQDSYFLLS